MGWINGIGDIKSITVRFIKWINPDTFYEKWIVNTSMLSKEYWVTFNMNPPAGFPSKTQIYISDHDDRPTDDDLSDLGQFLPRGKGSMVLNISLKDPEAQNISTLPGENNNSIGDNLDKAKALIDQGDCDQALMIINSILEKDSSTYAAYIGRAWCYNRKQDFDSAIKDYYKALELHPEADHLYKDIGIVYYQQGNNFQAAEVLHKYLMKHQDDGEAWYILALVTKVSANLDMAESLGQKDTYGLRQEIERLNQEAQNNHDREVQSNQRESLAKGIAGYVYVIIFIFIGTGAFIKSLFKKGSTDKSAEHKQMAEFSPSNNAPSRIPDARRYLFLMFITGSIINIVFLFASNPAGVPHP